MPALAVALMLQGCIFEYPDCPEDPWKHVEVRFDTSLCPDAKPEGMAVFLFPEDGSEPWRYDFTGIQGDTIDVPPGRYSLLAYNNDTYRVSIKDRNDFSLCSFTTPETGVFEALSPLTREAIPGGPPDGTESVSRQPQDMWCGAIDSLMIMPDNSVRILGPEESTTGATSDTLKSVIPVTLREAVGDITVEISPVGNIDDINQLCAVLTGMGSEYSCSAQKPSGKPATIPFAINRDSPTSQTLKGKLKSFGRDKRSREWVILYVWLNDGHKFYYKFEVTEMLADAPDPTDIHLKLGPIEIPESIGEDGEGGGGIDVGVDGWDFVIIDMES